MPRSYDQYCPVARAFEILGDRWAALIVRDLLLGPSRYTDLARGLPGVASDILTRRLRELEDAGVLRRRELEPPAAVTVYELTERGERLRGPLMALGRWGLEVLAPPPDPGVFTAPLLANAAQLVLRPGPDDDLEVQLVSDGEHFTVRIRGGSVVSRRARATDPDLVLSGAPAALAAVLAGGQDPDDAGVEVSGNSAVLTRLREMAGVPARVTPPAM